MLEWITEPCFQVECSGMADMAQEIVKQNGFSNGSALISLKFLVFNWFIIILEI